VLRPAIHRATLAMPLLLHRAAYGLDSLCAQLDQRWKRQPARVNTTRDDGNVLSGINSDAPADCRPKALRSARTGSRL
jgi:hypothetical protein